MTCKGMGCSLCPHALFSQAQVTNIYCKSAPCGPVKVCSEPSCSYVAAVRDKRQCKLHPSAPLNHVNDCPVEFAYLSPENSIDNHHWIFAFVEKKQEKSD